MHRRLVRVGLVLITLVVAAVTLYQLFRTQQEIDDQLERERLFSASASALAVRLTDLRAAQQAYVAAGQDPGYWVEKVSAGMTDVSSELGTLTDLASTADADGALEEAGLLVQRLARVDTLAREHTAAEQALMASDLIFTDGFEISTRILRQLDLARVAEQDAYAQRRIGPRRTQTLALAALVATALVVTLLLLPVMAATPASAQNDQDSSDEAVESDDSGAPASLPETPGRAVEPTAPSEPTAAVASPHHDELQRAAQLCTDLGRLTRAEELPVMLERAADLLHASGLILWVRDASGTGLRPAVAHGYTGEALAQMGGVACSSDNAAAAAYRSRQMQVVPVGGDATKGAVVAPLLAPDDCIGVMAAEVKAGWESSSDVQATASILAAQLATLVTADPSDKVDVEAEQAHG